MTEGALPQKMVPRRPSGRKIKMLSKGRIGVPVAQYCDTSVSGEGQLNTARYEAVRVSKARTIDVQDHLVDG
jgi:hypothetical protein